MNTIAKTILAFAVELPEGTILSAKELLHLGERAAIDQALSRLAKRGELIRLRRGLFALPVKSRFGHRAPSAETVVESIAEATGEVVTESGATAANRLGLTTQNPTRQVYWTSGKSRKLQLGAQTVELRQVRSWQVLAPGRRAGSALRAMAWFGEAEAGPALMHIKSELTASEQRELLRMRRAMPTWLAKELSGLAAR
ncbi:MAG: DUF6088 family protein [Rhodobacter sp.]|nr:DUF6088 family protein [Rhodobacter sp.]MCY4243474.1 DUF6088 family protein [Rhodobacter sp.]